MRALTIKQPYASLIVAGIKDVENRTWPPPKTLPQWWRCSVCTDRGRWEFTATDPPVCVGHHAELDMVPDGPLPFRLGVHAGKADTDNDRSIPRMAWDALSDVIGGDAPVRGALLGSVLVTGCHHAGKCFDLRYADGHRPPMEAHWCSRWAEPDCYHWTLTDPQPLSVQIPMRGRQGLWALPDDVVVPS